MVRTVSEQVLVKEPAFDSLFSKSSRELVMPFELQHPSLSLWLLKVISLDRL
jgi:hypothetical protein